jgi:class 3 adenylate cyclase/tetratricopeptide (TPR) repeat protein
MICQVCGQANSESAVACRGCGESLQRTCSHCLSIISVAANFCSFCGASALSAGPDQSSEERRPLTVMFCDLVGSTEMSQLVDPEDLRDVLDWYHAACNRAIQSNGGHTAQYLGDGVVAYFGYPRSREDDGERAVRCGLDILITLREQSSHFGHLGIEVEARIGIHTGRVVVSSVGDNRRRDLMAVGDTPNVAARIQAAAEPGSVFVSATTWRMVEGRFAGVPVGLHTLKGVASPMQLWRVADDTALSPGSDAPVARTAFVGRHRESDILIDTWRQSQSGAPAFVLVRGDPGIGKSRLASHFAGDLGQGTRILVMRAQAANSASPFAPVIDLLEQELQLRPRGDTESRVARIQRSVSSLGVDDPEDVSILSRLISRDSTGSRSDAELTPGAERVRAMGLLLKLLASVAALDPTLLIADDLQWADPSTVELLGALVTDPPAVPLLGLFTARPDFRPEWCQPGAVQVVELEPLAQDDAEALIRTAASGKALPGEVVRQIERRSSRVPLFIEELTRAVLDSGSLRERSASWEAVGHVSATTIPLTVDASLISRIDRLGPTRPTALLAATIGSQFSLDLLGQVSRRDMRLVKQDVLELLDSRIIVEVDPRRRTYAFSHALLRDAAYGILTRGTRQQYHRAIAAALSDVGNQEALVRADLVAHHLMGAGEYEAAIGYWESASRQASTKACYSEAVENLRQALACLAWEKHSQERDERELALQTALSPLLMTVYGWGSSEVEEAVERCVALAELLNRPIDVCGLRWGVWSVRLLQGDMHAALAAARSVKEAAALAGPIVGPIGENAMALTLCHRAEFTQLLMVTEEGLALCSPEMESALIQHLSLAPSVGLHCCRAVASWMVEDPDEAVEHWTMMLEHARTLDHPPSLAAALVYTLQAGCFRSSYHGDLQDLLPISEELTVLCQEFYFWAAANLACRGVIEQTLGHNEQARAKMLEGLELFEHTGARCGFVHMAVFCAEAFFRMGDDDQAMALLAAAERDYRQRGEALFAPEIWRIRGRIAARRGESSRAEEQYSEAIALARGQSARPLELRAALDRFDLLSPTESAVLALPELTKAADGMKPTSHMPELDRSLSIISRFS